MAANDSAAAAAPAVIATTAAPAAPERTSPIAKFLRAVFALVLLLTVVAVLVPLAPAMPADRLDPSWMFGMNQAVAQGLVFGRDMVFTFGPYASVYTRAYHPATDAMMLWASLWLALSFALAAWLVFRRAHAAVQVGLLLVLAVVMYSRDALLFLYPLLVVTWVYRSTAGEAGEGRSRSLWLVGVAVLFAPFGLLPLVKGSVLLACAALGGLGVVRLGLRRDGTAIVVAIASPALAMAICWALAGQPVTALPGYFIAMAPIIGGYSEAMSIAGDPWHLLSYVAAAGVVLWALAHGAPGTRGERAVLLAMFALVLFLAFKGGFVRHDSHVLLANTTLLLLALLAATFGGRRAAVALVVVVLVWIHIDRGFVKTDATRLQHTVVATYLDPWRGLRSRLQDGGRLQRDFDARVAQLARQGGIPRLDGTVDIYSFEQSFLIASGNRWNPRPVLQSYSVYTPELAERNRRHLLGAGRPDHIVFKLQPIDGRFPSLDDGASWPALLAGYRPTALDGNYLFLAARPRGTGGDAPTALATGDHRFGERVEIPAANGPVFARLVIRPSLLGRLANTLFKPSPLQITTELENGTVRSHRLVAGMAQAGFVLSPAIDSTPEFGLLYAGVAALEGKAVRAITLAAPTGSALWNPAYTLQLERLADPADTGVLKLFSFVQPVPAAELPAAVAAVQCDASIDLLNGVSPAPRAIRTRRLLEARGWLAVSARDGKLPERPYLVLTAADGQRHFIPTSPTPRPDVGAHFGRRELDASGYTVSADVSGLRGRHSLALAYLDGGAMHLCSQFDIVAELGPGETP